MQVTERERLQHQRDALNRQYRGLMRGRVVPNGRAQSVQRKIEELKKEIERLDRDATERLSLEKAPIDDILEVVAIPLIADVMVDIVAGVDATLRRAGVQETVFGMHTAQIRRAALAMVDTLDHADANLPRLLDVDDTLVDAIKKKLMSFIKQRLNITE